MLTRNIEAGDRVRFTPSARKAMEINPEWPSDKPLRTPQGGAGAVYTVELAAVGHGDVILRENGERWGLYWLELVEGEG